MGPWVLINTRCYKPQLRADRVGNAGLSDYRIDPATAGGLVCRQAAHAAGRRRGLAQSLFQVGGNVGQALGPLAGAIVVLRWGQSSLLFFALLALLSCAVLWNVAIWYRFRGLPG